MADKQGYAQFCPVAVASEILSERWTVLVLRGLFCGATRYNDIQASVPRMSSALLARRLKELAYANIIERYPATSGRGFEYRLTRAGEELFPVIDRMGVWAQKWLRREITNEKNLDPDVLMWELRQTVLRAEHRVEKRRVVRFQLDDVPVAKRFYWLVFEPADVEICVKDPGYEVDLWVHTTIRTLVAVWLGHRSLSSVYDDESLCLDGDREEVKAFRQWYARSPFAEAGELPEGDVLALAGA